MIELITASPGGGKTAYAVNELLGIVDEGRPIFQHGVSEFKLRHEPVKCEDPHCVPCQSLPVDALRALDWHLWAPQGAILLFDEVQKIYRPRSSSSKVPDSIAAFETHRHRGLDFICITQHPSLIDSNLKNLVSKHIHLTGTWLRRVKYEWGECHTNVLSTTTAVKTTYRLPKKVYPLYKSAEIHTKLKRAIPPQFYAVFILIALVALGVYRLVSSQADKVQTYQTVPGSSAPGSFPTPPTGTAFSPAMPQHPQSFDFVPTVINHPESAPAYAQIVKVTDFPKLAGCIKSKDKCTCYTQQATQYLVSPQECADFIATPRFNPYHTHDGDRVTLASRNDKG